eukprot:gene11870-24871_t
MDDKLWLFGMTLNILGSVMVNFGTNLMKSAHNLVQSSHVKQALTEADPGAAVSNSKSSLRIWRIGMAVFVSGSFVNFASFAFAAQSLLAALGTVQFVSNVVFAKCVLKEQLTIRIFIATSIIIFGLSIAIRFSNHASEEYTTKDLIALYDNTYLIFLLCIVIFLISLHIVYLRYTYSEEKGIRLPASDIVRPAAYAIVSATVGTQSVLQSKCIAELVKASIKGQNQLGEWFLYVILITFIVGLSFWLHRMNAALKKFDGLVIIPLLQVFWTTSAILQGGVYFKEFEKFSPLQTVGFCMGVMTVFIGVFLLTPHKRRDHEAMMEQALITEDGTPASQDDNEMDNSVRSSISNSAGGPHDTATTTSRRQHAFSNCGLSAMDESERGSVSMERLLSLTYMPVVLNDASVAFYLDRAFVSSNAGRGAGGKGGGGATSSINSATGLRVISECSLSNNSENSSSTAPALVKAIPSSINGPSMVISSPTMPGHAMSSSSSMGRNRSASGTSNVPRHEN